MLGLPGRPMAAGFIASRFDRQTGKTQQMVNPAMRLE